MIIANPRSPSDVRPFALSAVEEDVWHRADGTWRLASSHVLQLRTGGRAGVGTTGAGSADGRMLQQAQWELIRQQLQAAQDMTRSMNCMHGIGYGCGVSPR
jgi:hypothetical protein